MESLLQQRFGDISAQSGRDLGVAGWVLHHISHPLLPGVSDGVDTPGAGTLDLRRLLPEGLHQVGHVCSVLFVDLGQLVVEVTDWKERLTDGGGNDWLINLLSLISLKVLFWWFLRGSMRAGWTRSLIISPSWPISTVIFSLPGWGLLGPANWLEPELSRSMSRWSTGMRSGRKGRRSVSSGGWGGEEGMGWKGDSSGSLTYPLVSVLTK